MAIALSVADTASITSLDDLLNIVPEYMDGRGDNSLIPSFVRLAEAEINRRLALKPVRRQMTRGVLSLEAEYVDIPDLFQKEISLEVTANGSRREVRYVEPINVVGASDDQNRWWLYDCALNEAGDVPQVYTVLDGEIRLYPVPTQAYSAVFTYFARIPALTTSNQTNWFLADNADVYLYGTLSHANAFLPDQAKADYWGTLFDNRLSAVLEAYPKASSQTLLRVDGGLSQLRCERW